MKKQMIIIAIIAMMFTYNQAKSQNISSQIIVFDTVNISVENHQITADRDIYVGQMKVYDPERDNLYYSINSQEFEGLFYIDQRGVIRANYRQMLRHYSQEEFDIEVEVSDGLLSTNGLVVIKVFYH